MDFRKLRYFLNVAEQGSFHSAAGTLNIAQSALSRQIQQLEEELGASLLLRSTKGVKLSPAGEVFLAEVRQLLSQFEVARNNTWRAARGQFGRVRIACTARVAEMKGPIAAFAAARREMPDVDFQLRIVSPEKQTGLILDGEIDVGLLYKRPPDLLDLLVYKELRLDRVKLLTHVDHPLTSQPSIRLADLRGFDFAFTSHDVAAPMYNELMAACLRGGLNPRITMTIPYEGILMNVASEGLIIGFCDSSVVERRSMKGLALLDVEDLDVVLETTAMWERDKETPAISRFIEHLEAEFDRSREAVPGPSDYP